jgi:O-antigen ligase
MTIQLAKQKSIFDWFCDIVMLIFLSVVMAYGPDIHRVFIPAEILFVATFGARFLIKRSKITNAFVGWSLAFLFLSVISVMYANNTSLAISRLKSVIQVLVFGNLVLPYIKESDESFKRFLRIYILAIFVVIFRLIVSTPIEQYLSSRLGDSIHVNSNTIGYMLSISTLIYIYLAYSGKRWIFLLLVPLLIFLALLSGSKKVFILLFVGIVLMVLLVQESKKRSFIAAGIVMLVLVVGGISLVIIEPLKMIIGQRLLKMVLQLFGTNIDGSTSERMGMIVSGLSMFTQKPIFGWGLGAFTDLGGFETYAHNNYVELLVAVGLVGTLVYYSLCFSIVVQGLKRFFRFEKKGPFVLSTAIMTAMLFDQVARVTYTEEFSNILIAMCYAGIVLDTPDKGLDFFQLMAKIGEYIRHPSRFVNHLLKSKLARLLPNTLFLSLKYRMSNGKKCNIKEPSTYNEKLQWQKIYDHNPLYPHIVDKYEVRSHVSSLIGESYLVPLVGVYDDPSAIILDTLPDKFVIKPTHPSGDVLFCYDKKTFDWEHAHKVMSQWMNSNYYWYDREWPYKEIKPRIIIEHLIKTEDGKPPKDYKIFCFGGEPKMAFVASDRPDDTKFDFFDIAWNRLNLKQHYPNSTYEIPKPKQWDTMLVLAKTLSAGLPQVRVDLYVDADEQILFGELTLFHFSGFEPFEPDSYDELLGSWVSLPKGRV